MLTSKYSSDKAWENVPVPYSIGTKVVFNIPNGDERSGSISAYNYSFGRPRATSFSLSDNLELFYPVDFLRGCQVVED